MEDWDLIIEPHRKLLDLKLRDLWRYKDLVLLFVRRDFVSVYKQTILGPLWYLIQPLLTTVIFTFIFGNLAVVRWAIAGGSVYGNAKVYASTGAFVTQVQTDCATGNYRTSDGLSSGTYYVTGSADGYRTQLFSGTECGTGCTVTGGAPVAGLASPRH